MTDFASLGLQEDILKAIESLGFETPTPVQAKVIPLLLDSKQDLVALAQTGTGKTAAFGLPLIQQVDTDSKAVQALILCPTRELCLQICKDLKQYSKHMHDVRSVIREKMKIVRRVITLVMVGKACYCRVVSNNKLSPKIEIIKSTKGQVFV